MIPSPYVTNNHQYHNAMALVNKNAAVIIEEKDLTSERLISMINEVLKDDSLYNKMKNKLKEMSMDNSSDLIYTKIKDLIK